jgi:hypothetical protein
MVSRGEQKTNKEAEMSGWGRFWPVFSLVLCLCQRKLATGHGPLARNVLVPTEKGGIGCPR